MDSHNHSVSDFWFGAYIAEWDRNTMPRGDDRIKQWFTPTPGFKKALTDLYLSECQTLTDRSAKPSLDIILLYDQVSRIIFRKDGNTI